ncbi:MAG TPA: hypothetical protein VMZ11_01665 [Mycobacteriales bacterium]|nr:hypothetical protein [Mycobacteriales bacterium]
MFRDSRGVVHTVSSPDPLTDVPESAASALAGALLVRSDGDLGGVLERCEAVAALLDHWQDAFFAALPAEVDLEEEERYAAEAGVSLADVEREWEDWAEDDLGPDEGPDGADDEDEVAGQLDLDVVDLDDEAVLLGHRADPITAGLDESLVHELERDLLLLPMRVRLEALLGASALVATWSELMADHEKCLGHLVLQHGTNPEDLTHEALVDRHAELHAGSARHEGAVP